ncbi:MULTISPECIES: hypothetical protein [Francisella]|uniref:Uncharacterized protein n=2 Tax=Francisella TaxID=262 RepID=A0AAJ4NMM9_9GAMM|nr:MULTISPECIES: hypothetical protein [Francisella]QEO57298.1 hypothetical protein F0R74_05285 [Francisella marina]QEO58587.1 hypothetical protein F0R75_01940 [Francisella marina]QWU98793.1 hypothetical protein KQR59_06675 [Francisella salimarina]
MNKVLVVFVILIISADLYAIVAGNSLNITSSKVKTVEVDKNINKPFNSRQLEDDITMVKTNYK